MGRSGYSDDSDDMQALAMWRGRVASAMRGKRGQALLRDCLTALDEMPAKRLVRDELVHGNDVCLLGAGGRKRGITDLDKIDPEAHGTLADRFNVASCLIQEIEWVNDDDYSPYGETPEERFKRVRKWLVENIKQTEAA